MNQEKKITIRGELITSEDAAFFECAFNKNADPFGVVMGAVYDFDALLACVVLPDFKII